MDAKLNPLSGLRRSHVDFEDAVVELAVGRFDRFSGEDHPFEDETEGIRVRVDTHRAIVFGRPWDVGYDDEHVVLEAGIDQMSV